MIGKCSNCGEPLRFTKNPNNNSFKAPLVTVKNKEEITTIICPKC